jgi:RNA recognition motif-containing protein
VAYSDPSRKKKRHDAVSDGRELFVKMGGGTTEEDLRKVFSKYGKVTGCRVNGSRNPGKGMATGFVDFETKEEAEKAMAELDNTKLGSHIMRVELAQERVKISGKLTRADSEAPSPAASTRDAEGDTHMHGENAEGGHAESGGDWRQRRMAIMGLPDTVNDARVMALAETVGKVNQVTVQPLKGTAIVEFAVESDVGRALLKLDGHEMDGATLKAGTIRDLHSYTSKLSKQEAEQQKQQKSGSKGQRSKDEHPKSSTKPMFAPPQVRRPVLGKAAPKRGLGFVPRKTGDNSSNTDGDAKKTDGPAAARKSNADFKAMFIKSGEQNESGSKEEKRSWG